MLTRILRGIQTTIHRTDVSWSNEACDETTASGARCNDFEKDEDVESEWKALAEFGGEECAVDQGGIYAERVGVLFFFGVEDEEQVEEFVEGTFL